MAETEQNWDSYIDGLIDIMQSVDLHKVTVLTGRNGGGKSMIRKLLAQFLAMKYELRDRDRDRSPIVASISMDARAGIDAGMGFNQMFSRDLEWLPTSENTFHQVEDLLKSKDRFLVLDELELGMGEELQAGLAGYINETLKTRMDDLLGVLVITHSRAMVKYLDHDAFINLEGMTEEEWLNREVIPMSPEDLQKKSRELYLAFQKRLAPRKQ